MCNDDWRYDDSHDIPALIADARSYAGGDEYPGAILIHKLVDALEAEHARAEFLYQDILFRASDTTEEQS